MKSYEYLEQNATKTTIFIILYLGVWIVGASLYFGGFGRLADAINNFGSAKGIGLLVGVLVIVPIFFIMRFVYAKVIVQIDQEKVVVRYKDNVRQTFDLSTIDSMVTNEKRPNTLHFYNQSKVLIFALVPIANQGEIIEEIPEYIATLIPFKRTSREQKFFTTTYRSYIYRR